MKRQSDIIIEQLIKKKPDARASKDLRSQIGAKLQTLLQAKKAKADELRRKRALLLGEPVEPEYPEIIIDPTIVVKTEPIEIEERYNSTTALNSPNFLLSAKSRLTELLTNQQGAANKYKNHGKENSSSKCSAVSSVNCATTSSNSLQNQTSCSLQSFSCNLLSKKKKVHNNNNKLDASSGVLLKNVYVVLEDIMKNGSKYSHLLPAKSVNKTYSQNPEISSRSKKNSTGRLKKKKVAKVPTSSKSCDIVLSTIYDSTSPQSCKNSSAADCVTRDEKCSKSSDIQTKESSVSLDACDVQVIDLGDFLIAPEESLINNLNDTGNDPELVNTEVSELLLPETVVESELVDDPSVLEDGNNSSSVISCNDNLNNESPDPDVVLLCVKKPTHEVITLEDVDESEDLVEEVHECWQCGKAFCLKSLLNFHVKMHGSDSFCSPSFSGS